MFDKAMFFFKKRFSSSYLDSEDVSYSSVYPPIYNWKKFLIEAREEFKKRMQTNPDKIATSKDFLFLKTLGKGAFGTVKLAQKKSSGIYYAIKLLDKHATIKHKQLKHALNERDILKSIRFTFVVHLEYFFQDNVYLYFVLPLAEGGELFLLLQQRRKFTEGISRFYAAQVLLALEYLHYLNLVYRDIKPENILLDRYGYLKMADFGFCKKVKQRTYTFCGTPEYIAPEIVNSKGYGKSVDYWSFGVFLYELNSGVTPFYSKSQTRIYEKITSGYYRNKDYFSSDLKDIIKHLLVIDLSRRYGILKHGVDDIKGHRWFRNIMWIPLVNREVRPPFVPESKGIDSTLFESYDDEPLASRTDNPYEKEFADF